MTHNSLDNRNSIPCSTQEFLLATNASRLTMWGTQPTIQMVMDATYWGVKRPEHGPVYLRCRTRAAFAFMSTYASVTWYSDITCTLILSLPFSIIENAVCVVRLQTRRPPPDVSGNKLPLIGQQ